MGMVPPDPGPKPQCEAVDYRGRRCEREDEHPGYCATFDGRKLLRVKRCPSERPSGERCDLDGMHDGPHKHSISRQLTVQWADGAYSIGARCTATQGDLRCTLPEYPAHVTHHAFDDPAPERCTDLLLYTTHLAMKAGKLQLELIDLAFVADMAKQLQAGNVGDRVPNDWRELDPAVWVDKYRGALMRHLVAADAEPNAIDPKTGATHWAAVAVNAMICGVLERIALSKGGESEPRDAQGSPWQELLAALEGMTDAEKVLSIQAAARMWPPA